MLTVSIPSETYDAALCDDECSTVFERVCGGPASFFIKPDPIEYEYESVVLGVITQ
jgi:hypothetical protein